MNINVDFQLIKDRFLRSKFIQQLLVPFGNKLEPEKWIFIIGCYNSGTTLLKSILSGAHDQIGTMPSEGVFLTDGMKSPEELNWTRMWYKCLEDIEMGSDQRNSSLARRIKKQWSFSFGNNTPCLLEKSISNAVRIPFLNKYFKPAYFIYLVRDGYAVSEGIRRKAKPKRWNNPMYKQKYPIELCTEQWRMTDVVVEKSLSGVDRSLKIKYEDLTEYPIKTINKITDFLKIEPLKKVDLEGRWRIVGYNEPIKNMNKESHVRLSCDDMGKIKQTAGDTLEKYNYSKPDC